MYLPETSGSNLSRRSSSRSRNLPSYLSTLQDASNSKKIVLVGELPIPIQVVPVPNDRDSASNEVINRDKVKSKV